MNPNPFTITARWAFPVSSPPIEHAKITVQNGTILSVESDATPGDYHFPDHFIIPGLVNAHTHLDLSGLRGKCPPSSDFTGWLKQVIAYRRQQTPEMIQSDIQFGIDELVKSGTMLVGDINVGGTSFDLLERSPLHALVYFEVLGLTEAGATKANASMGEWLKSSREENRIHRGLSPHAPYSVSRSLFTSVAERARVTRAYLATHLAETKEELELLKSHRGPFRAFLESLGVWYESGLVRTLDEVFSILRPAESNLWIHANYLNPEVALPFNSAIVYCPRTHAAFGHPPHPFREFLKRNRRVILGTDSLASNPDLDILREAVFVRDLHPDFPGNTLLSMITNWAAEALNRFVGDGVDGRIEEDSAANLVVMPIGSPSREDPYEMIWDAVRKDLPRGSMWCGTPIAGTTIWTEHRRNGSLELGVEDRAIG